jgi:hypothetical protein
MAKAQITSYTKFKKSYNKKLQKKKEEKALVWLIRYTAIVFIIAFLLGIIIPTVTAIDISYIPQKDKIIYTIPSPETKISPREEIIIPKVIKDTTPKKTLAREAKNPIINKVSIAQSDVQRQVQAIASEYGWGIGPEWEALAWIVQKESSWRIDAQNPKSTAFGLFQHLDGTRKAYNCPKTLDIRIQTECGIRYIQARYKTATEAQKFHLQRGWY